MQVSCTGYIDPDFRTKLEAQKLPIIFPKHVNWTTISNPETSTKVNKYNDQFIKVPPPEYGPNHPYIQMLWNDVNMKKNSTSPGYTDEYGYDSFRGLSFPISAIADLNTIMDTEFFVRGHQHEMQPFPLEHDKKFVNVISSLYLPYLKTKGLQNNLGILIINDKDIKFEKIADLEKEDVLAIQHKLIDAFGDDIINECKYVTGIFNQNSGNKTIVKEGDTPYYFGSLVIEAQPKTTSASSPSGVSVDLLPSSNPIGSSGGGKPKSVPKPPKSRYQLAEIPPYRGSSDHFRSRALSPQPTSDSSGHPKSQTPISPNISYDTPLQDKNKDQAGQQ